MRHLRVRYDQSYRVFDGISLSLERGERLGIAGESGCGKTTLLKSIVGLHQPSTTVEGEITVRGRAGYIPQQALANLSPFMTVGQQLTELTLSSQRTDELLAMVGLAGRKYRRAYPDQLSGGERQRVLALQAFAMRPDIIIADEPTANLDANAEADLLNAIDRYSRETRAAILIASHRERVFDALGCRVHRMTLVENVPLRFSPQSARGRPLLEVRSLTKTFRRRDWLTRTKPVTRAINTIDMRIGVRECVVLFGASGAGKSTLARCLAGRERPDSGTIRWFCTADHSANQRVQLVQQEPSESLNPYMSIRDALREAGIHDKGDCLERVRLPSQWIDRRTHELSEGQRARIAILRAAAALRKGLLILDESLSGLDPMNRGYILAFLSEIQQERDISLLLITHDPDISVDLHARILRLSAGQLAES